MPGASEADVAEADGAPGEDGRKARYGQEPVEDRVLLLEVGEVGQQAESASHHDGNKGPSPLVDVAENLRGLAEIGEGGEGSRGTEDGRVADGQDGDEDDGVHHRGEDVDAGRLDGNDEGRGVGVRVAGAHQVWVIVRHEQANQRQGDNVEEADAPKHLLDGCRERLSRVCRFGRR